MNLNDALIGDVLTWTSEQTTATIVGGDMNTTVKACKYLACAECLALTVISPFQLASTVDKQGIPSKGWALDHVTVNAPLRDMWSESAVHQDILPADHYPVTFELALPIVEGPTLSLPVARKGARQVVDLPYPYVESPAFSQWQEAAEWWIVNACQAEPLQRACSFEKTKTHKAPKVDCTLSRLTSLRCTIACAQENGWNMKLARRYRRQIASIKMLSLPPLATPSSLLKICGQSGV